MNDEELLLAGFEAWWVMRNRGHKTMLNYQSSLRRFATFAKAEGKSLVTADHRLCGVYLAKRLSQVTAVTVHGDYKAMRAFYGWLVKVEQEIPTNPMDRVGPPEMVETERYAATEEDYRKLLKVCDANPDKVTGRRNAAIIALLWSGMRRGELCALEVSNVDAIEGDLTIPRTKTGKVRKVTLMDNDMVLRLQRWMRVRPRDKGEGLFVGKKGTLTPDGITQVFSKVRDDAGLPHVSPHAFRRGRTVAMLEDEIDGSLIMAHMGWSSERMKARYAREHTEELARRAIKRRYRSAP
jgi:integrase